jgi:hypothetical protein
MRNPIQANTKSIWLFLCLPSLLCILATPGYASGLVGKSVFVRYHYHIIQCPNRQTNRCYRTPEIKFDTAIYFSTKNRAFLYFGNNMVDNKGTRGDFLVPQGRWKRLKGVSIRIKTRGNTLIYEEKFKKFAIKHTIDLSKSNKDICSVRVDQKFFNDRKMYGKLGPWNLQYCKLWHGNHWAKSG